VFGGNNHWGSEGMKQWADASRSNSWQLAATWLKDIFKNGVMFMGTKSGCDVFYLLGK
jgi:hypothetical protein